jgi:signal transduction histidine kinase
VLLAEAARLRSLDTVHVDVSGISAGQVLGDAAQLTQVARNLVDNAARHATSTVRLALAERHGRVVLTVADDGPGIDPADRARIFERFTRLDDARARDTGGYGLGLAIVHQVVNAHHGQVRVDDSAVSGASFVVDLPANPH